MIPGIGEYTRVNGVLVEGFPSGATLHQATISFEEMGGRTITTQVKIDGDTTPDFSTAEWVLEYNGEYFTLNTHTPQATKDTTTRCSLIDLTFESQSIQKLKQYFFVELAQVATGTVIINKFVCPLRLKAEDFIAAYRGVLQYYFGNTFTIEIAQGTQMPQEVKDVDINYTYLWEAAANFYDVYGLVWRLAPKSGGYKIVIGDTIVAIEDHVFQYGYSGGLQKIERQVQDDTIYNQLFGRGGEKNLPYRYFKKVDPNNELFAGDPDACAELANVYFDRLLDINFRYYVKGWLRNPARTPSEDYPVPSTPEPADVQAHWAYQKGLTDLKFDPIEYVQDLESIAEYGVRQGRLEDNDEIYPTIQDDPDGLDQICAVSTITDGDDSGSIHGIKTTTLPDLIQQQFTNYNSSYNIRGNLPDRRYIELTSPSFKVAQGFAGRIEFSPYSVEDYSWMPEPYRPAVGNRAKVTFEDFDELVAIRESDNKSFPYSGPLPGGYSYHLYGKIAAEIYGKDKGYSWNVGYQNIRLLSSLAPNSEEDNGYTFRVWIKNVWDSTQNLGESDIAYVERIWRPILGDRQGNEARLVFSSGAMSASSDWEFTILDVSVDRTQGYGGDSSEWCLLLKKSDAELEATGKLIPNTTSAKPLAGDHFFFVGIDMPYSYVTRAEKRLNQTKTDALTNKAYTNPTWAVQLDGVRVNTLENSEEETLLSRMNVGTAIQIFDPRFTGGQNLTLTIRTMNIVWNEGTVMKPSVEIVLSENVLARSSASQILTPSAINARIKSATEALVESIWVEMGAPPYISKSNEDSALSSINFKNGATFGDYNQNASTGARIDPLGCGVMESLTLRKFLEVPELRFNRVDIQVGNYWRAPGGGLIERVEVDYDGDTPLTTGTIYLKTEEGEVCSIVQDDICMGIFHNETGNAEQDSDDGKGNFHFAGFSTCYFRVTEMLAVDCHIFKYALRPTDSTWTESHHPQASMSFVCYGNFAYQTNPDRLVSRYSTRTYERYLKNVHNWNITADNLAAQFGDLTNLTELNDLTHNFNDMTGYSAYLENIYMSGYIKQTVNPPALRVNIDTGGRYGIGTGETLTLTASAERGWETVASADIRSWAITRDSGSAAADAIWAQLTKVQAFNGTILLDSSDLSATLLTTLFTVTVTLTDNTTASETVAISKLENGSNAVILSLDKYSDAMPYDREGNKIGSANILVTAKLNDGGTDVTSDSAVTNWNAAFSGCTGYYSPTAATPSNAVIVTGLTSAKGTVTISCQYKQVAYSAVFTVTKLLAGDWYELVATPSAIAYNETTQEASANSINFKIYKNSQDANGAATRTLLTSLSTANYALYVAGTDVAGQYGQDGYTLSTINYANGSVSAGFWKKVTGGSNIMLAQVTVPIGSVENGAAGTPGGDGPVGVTYRVSGNFDDRFEYHNDVTVPVAGATERIIDIVSNKDIAMLSEMQDPNDPLRIYKCKYTHVPDEEHAALGDPDWWEDVSTLYSALAAPLILANQITAKVIDVDSLDTKLLTIKSSATAPSAPPSTCVGRMGDTTIYTVDGESKKFPFWIGGQYPYSSGTKFKIDEGGNIYASGGKVGPFIINYQGNSCLYATSGTTIVASSNFTPGMVNIGYATTNVGTNLTQQIGALGFSSAAYLGQYTYMSRDDSKDTSVSFPNIAVNVGHQIAVGANASPNGWIPDESEYYGIHNIGLMVNCDGARHSSSYKHFINYGIKVSAKNGSRGNYGIYVDSTGYAIWSPTGKMAGIRPYTRYITSGSPTLQWFDTTVVVNNSSAMTLSLPSSPQDGQIIYLHHLTATSVTISGNGKTIFYMRNGTEVNSQASTSREIGILVYSSSYGANGQWILHFLHL